MITTSDKMMHETDRLPLSLPQKRHKEEQKHQQLPSMKRLGMMPVYCDPKKQL
jgi:hypothetical protein